MLINVMLIKKTCKSNSFAALTRLDATAIDCAHELIKFWYFGKIPQNQ